ncbi:hypothetical protein BMS3Bbin06_02077 [bacterium BMS3Bbin06]|nr:hypothetical protein BMS3Bbin06_02077 [bacterium BMS3Bbin06]
MKSPFKIILTIIIAVSLSACSSTGFNPSQNDVARWEKGFTIDHGLREKLLLLDPGKITRQEVDKILSHAPAPRIININGSLPLITMDSFSRFLIKMGYPEESLRNPIDGSLSYSSYMDSSELAGLVAWLYEKEGMMPVLIGHSRGGMLVIKVLHEFSGAFRRELHPWNPVEGRFEKRTTIIDPLGGGERGITGLKVGFASAVATGKMMRFFLGQWGMINRLRKIPDTVEEFTGFFLKYDLIGSDLFMSMHRERYRPVGEAGVRNVWLPPQYSHITLPRTEHLADDEVLRKWIDEYIPSSAEPEFVGAGDADARNIILAAELWYGIKKFWCLELQRLIRARADEG